MPVEVVELRQVEPLTTASTVTGATVHALTAADRLDSPVGAAALVLAARLDLGADTGSAMASMTKELRAALTEALANSTEKADTVDELEAQRRKRLGVGS